ERTTATAAAAGVARRGGRVGRRPHEDVSSFGADRHGLQLLVGAHPYPTAPCRGRGRSRRWAVAKTADFGSWSSRSSRRPTAPPIDPPPALASAGSSLGRIRPA